MSSTQNPTPSTPSTPPSPLGDSEQDDAFLSNLEKAQTFDKFDKIANFNKIKPLGSTFQNCLIDEICSDLIGLGLTILRMKVGVFLEQQRDLLSERHSKVSDVNSAWNYDDQVSASRKEALEILNKEANADFPLAHFVEKINSFYLDFKFDFTSLESNKNNELELDIETVRAAIKERWKDRDRALGEDIPAFIARVYKQFIGKGLTRSHLKIDKELYRDQRKWISASRDKDFPKWLNVPKATRSRKNTKPPSPEEIETWRRVAAYRSQQQRHQNIN